MVLIRPASIYDLYAIGELYQEMLKFHAEINPVYRTLSARALERRMFFREKLDSESGYIGVADLEGEIVGYSLGYEKKETDVLGIYNPVGFLSELYVTRAQRKKGYGRLLADDIFRWMKNKNYQRVQLSLLADNREADLFWKALDFVPLSRTLEKRI